MKSKDLILITIIMSLIACFNDVNNDDQEFTSYKFSECKQDNTSLNRIQNQDASGTTNTAKILISDSKMLVTVFDVSHNCAGSQRMSYETTNDTLLVEFSYDDENYAVATCICTSNLEFEISKNMARINYVKIGEAIYTVLE